MAKYMVLLVVCTVIALHCSSKGSHAQDVTSCINAIGKSAGKAGPCKDKFKAINESFVNIMVAYSKKIDKIAPAVNELVDNIKSMVGCVTDDVTSECGDTATTLNCVIQSTLDCANDPNFGIIKTIESFVAKSKAEKDTDSNEVLKDEMMKKMATNAAKIVKCTVKKIGESCTFDVKKFRSFICSSKDVSAKEYCKGDGDDEKAIKKELNVFKCLFDKWSPEGDDKNCYAKFYQWSIQQRQQQAQQGKTPIKSIVEAAMDQEKEAADSQDSCILFARKSVYTTCGADLTFKQIRNMEEIPIMEPLKQGYETEETSAAVTEKAAAVSLGLVAAATVVMVTALI